MAQGVVLTKNKDNMCKSQTQKIRIADETRAYLKAHRLSQAEFARRIDVNPAFLSQMLHGKGNVKDFYFNKVADFLGLQFDKIYWNQVPTSQFKEILIYLEEARQLGQNRTIIGATGSGKTYTVNRYMQKHPQFTYRITASSFHSLSDMIYALLSQLDVSMEGGRVAKIKRLTEKLNRLYQSGQAPLIVIDEAENLTASSLAMLKTLYDNLHGVCPIVLIGTSQLIKKLDLMTRRDVTSVPQLVRRLKGGIRYLNAVNTRFDGFMDDINDPDLVTWLRTNCKNYGELHDYLEFARREVVKHNGQLDIRFFKRLHKIL